MTPGFIGGPEEGAGGGGGDEGGGPVTGGDPAARNNSSKIQASVNVSNLNRNSSPQNHLKCFTPHRFVNHPYGKSSHVKRKTHVKTCGYTFSTLVYKLLTCEHMLKTCIHMFTHVFFVSHVNFFRKGSVLCFQYTCHCDNRNRDFM